MVDEAVSGCSDDESDRDFITKLHDELEGRSDEAIAFIAELLYVHVLSISNMGVSREARTRRPDAELAPRPVEVPRISWTLSRVASRTTAPR